jgi:hypothetical protein
VRHLSAASSALKYIARVQQEYCEAEAGAGQPASQVETQEPSVDLIARWMGGGCDWCGKLQPCDLKASDQLLCCMRDQCHCCTPRILPAGLGAWATPTSRPVEAFRSVVYDAPGTN